MKKLTFQEKYDAIGKKDPFYEGMFCRPSCRARKPKPENVNFYDTAQEALQHGFRPCKICKPMEKLGETPNYVKGIIKELHQNPDLRIKDYDLRKRGIEPSQIRRWFKKHHHMTFQTYQRMMRINNRSIFGEPPTSANNKSVLNIVRITTPIGPMYACASSEGLCLLDFTDRRMLETEFKDLCKRLNAVILPGENAHLDHVQSEIQEYFSGKRKEFTVPLHTPGTEFQKSVWKILQEIPYGEVRSYKQQAVLIGNPKAVRAVASANGHNRIGIIIPCHRVIGSDGSLTGYGGGLHRKRWLLNFENENNIPCKKTTLF